MYLNFLIRGHKGGGGGGGLGDLLMWGLWKFWISDVWHKNYSH